MPLKSKKTYTYLFMSLAITLTASVGAFYYLRKEPSTKKSYTLLSHNTANILTNPIEYTSVLRELSTIDDALLRQAARKLLEIDTAQKAYTLSDHQVAAVEKALYNVLLAYHQSTPSPLPSTKAIQQEARAFLYERIKKTKNKKYELSFTKGRFSGFDKAMREIGAVRFSPLYYNTPLILWLQESSKHFDMQAFAQQWINSLHPHMKTLHKKAERDPKLATLLESYLITFLFDLYHMSRLFEYQGVEAWITLVTKLQNNALGNAQERIRCLVKLYETQDPDIICLQEADRDLTLALMKKGYYKPQQAKVSAHGTEEGSLILYKKKVFQPKNITTLPLNPEDINQYKTPQMSARSLRKLTNHEVAIHKVEHKGMIWLVASFHATSDGSNTPTFLQALFALQKRIEEKEGKKVLLLLGIDANTSDQPSVIQAGLKEDLQTIDALLAQYNGTYIRVKSVHNDNSTVQKERSTFQVQLKKTHVLTIGLSDFILVSQEAFTSWDKKLFTLQQKSTYLSPRGPNPDNNPSDHKAIALTFSLEAVEG